MDYCFNKESLHLIIFFFALGDEEENLTSIYEEEQDGLFGGISLFYFLIHSSFSALFPFLSLVLYHHGFTYSQIGTTYTIMFIISCISATAWRYITDRMQTKHTVMLFSIAAWLLGYIPLLWVKHEHDPVIHCNVSTKTSNQTMLTSINRTEIFKSVQKNISLQLEVESKFKEWLQVDHTFMTLLLLLGLGRFIQSSTDYFYFEHNHLLYPESISKKLSKPSYHISTRVSAAIITLFTGYVLDSVIFCNETMGHFKIIFYFFIVFGSFALFVLYFLDINQFRAANGATTYDASQNHPDSRTTFLSTIFTASGLIVQGATRAIYYTFLQLHLAQLGGLYFQIGAVFTIHKIVETCIRMSRKKFCNRINNFYIIFIIIFTVDFIRNLYFSYLNSGLLLWLLLPMEMLSGFSALLYPSAATHSSNFIGGYAFFVPYWWIGFSFAPIIFGFGYQKFSSADVMFKIVSFTNLTFAVLYAGLYICCQRGSSRDSNHEDGDNDDDNVFEENDFLIAKSHSH